jgi:hypothetical protein
MNTVGRYLKKTWIPAVAGLLLLLLATSPQTFGGDSALSVAGCETAGTVVEVTVANSSSETLTATVRVAASVDGNLMVRVASVTVGPDSAVTAHVGFPTDIQQIILVGIKDHGSPF